ncbi:alkaline phosphatase D family protein [Actinopolymorpha pittospori]
MSHHSEQDAKKLSRRRMLTAFGGVTVGVLFTDRAAAHGASHTPPNATAGGTPTPAALPQSRAFAGASARRSLSELPAGGVPSDPFRLGVASGEPWPDSVVLWTRLAPEPLHGGGMPDRAVSVQWQVANDERFTRVVAAGTALARPAEAHSVHVEPEGLLPGRDYFYRFRAGREISPVGRTRTAPARHARPERLRVAVASCQHYQEGYFVAHRDLAEQDLDFVAFLGDYIYETKPLTKSVRRHQGEGEARTLADYRNRYAQYKADPDLRAAHASCPWIVTFDDHEVANDWSGDQPQDPRKESPTSFRARRAAALRAWYEHTPVRRTAAPRAGGIAAHRRFQWGDLARIHVLDTRQHRSPRAKSPRDYTDPDRTMTGAAQERWLLDGLNGGRQLWNLLANQVPMARTDRRAGPEQHLWADPWDGFQAQRARLLKALGAPRVANPVVLSGDRHFTMVCDLERDFDVPDSPVVATEIVGTSMTSGGDQDQAAWHRQWDRIIAESPYWKYGDARRGYVVCDVDRERLLATLRVASRVGDPDATVRADRKFVVQAGRRGLDTA